MYIAKVPMKSIIKAKAFTNAPVSAACQGLRRKGYINCTCVVRGNVVAMTMESQPTNYIYIYIYIYMYMYMHIYGSVRCAECWP